jgi:heme-degrading monooxygenase HmoA
MFAVIFEVQPRRERWDDYLALAKLLKPELEKIDGFIDNERFASRRVPGRLLSLSTWRDEKAIIRWRTLALHHGVQEKGRGEIFADYHLRVGEITADSHVPPGQSLRQQRFDETEIGAAKAVSITELAAEGATDDLALSLGLPMDATHGLVAHDVFESITVEGKTLLLASWQDAASAESWTLPPMSPPSMSLGARRHRQVRVVRDYGMFDRREAPQFYPPASSPR